MTNGQKEVGSRETYCLQRVRDAVEGQAQALRPVRGLPTSAARPKRGSPPFRVWRSGVTPRGWVPPYQVPVRSPAPGGVARRLRSAGLKSNYARRPRNERPHDGRARPGRRNLIRRRETSRGLCLKKREKDTAQVGRPANIATFQPLPLVTGSGGPVSGAGHLSETPSQA